jgi:hypothetical protein
VRKEVDRTVSDAAAIEEELRAFREALIVSEGRFNI